MKKVDEKVVAKNEVMAMVSKMLEANGIKFDDGMEYGFTEGTIVIHLEKFDVQLKPIAPKRGVERYEKKA